MHIIFSFKMNKTIYKQLGNFSRDRLISEIISACIVEGRFQGFQSIAGPGGHISRAEITIFGKILKYSNIEMF